MLTGPLWLRDLAAFSFQAAALVIAASVLLALLRLRAPRVRLAYWQLLLAACFIEPLIEPWRPQAAATGGAQVALSIGQEVAAAVAPARPFPWPELILAVLLAGIAVRLFWVGLGLVRLRAYRHRSLPFDAAPIPVYEAERLVAAKARVVVARGLASPAAFGLRSPAILFPPRFLALSRAQQRAIACHELLHVRRGDWAWTLAEEFVLSVLWFHPAIWWVVRNIRLSREQTVDAEVVRLTRARKDYLEALLEVARAGPNPRAAPAAPLLGESQLAARVAVLVKEVRMSKSKLVASCVLAAAALLATGRAAVWAFPLRSPAIAQNATAPGSGVVGGVGGGVAAGVSGGVQNGVRDGVQDGAVTVRRAAEKIFKPIYTVDPKYPPLARKNRVEGTVVLSVTINQQGAVTDVNVVSCPPPLAPAAVAAVKQWRFEPSPLLPATTRVEIDFRFAPRGAWSVISPGVSATLSPSSGLRLARAVAVTYPRAERISGASGAVSLGITVDTKGTVSDLRVLSGEPALAQAALEAIKQWRFEPPKAPVTTTVTVTFRAPRVIIRTNPASGGQPTAAPPRASAAANPAGGVSEESSNLTLIHSVTPAYPPLARMARIQGAVVLDVTVDAGGNVTDAKVVSGHPLLVRAALDAVKQFKFAPPANPPATTTVTINFRLQADEVSSSPGQDNPPAGPQHAPGKAGSASGSAYEYHGEKYQYRGVTSEAHIVKPVMVYTPDPHYTRQAREAKLQGDVILSVVVGKDGKVMNVKEVSKPLGEGLDESAIKTVRTWEFKPGTRDGKPVDVEMPIKVTFRLF